MSTRCESQRWPRPAALGIFFNGIPSQHLRHRASCATRGQTLPGFTCSHFALRCAVAWNHRSQVGRLPRSTSAVRRAEFPLSAFAYVATSVRADGKGARSIAGSRPLQSSVVTQRTLVTNYIGAAVADLSTLRRSPETIPSVGPRSGSSRLASRRRGVWPSSLAGAWRRWRPALPRTARVRRRS
jgi:hypothetical protein